MADKLGLELVAYLVVQMASLKDDDLVHSRAIQTAA